MKKIDKKKFFNEFKNDFDGSLDSGQIAGIDFLLDSFEAEPMWKDIRHVSYALATIYHETAGSMQPVEEGYYLIRYGAGRVKSFQKSLRYFPYFGRGYVQLTWKTNYERAGKALGIPLLNNPELALDREASFQILTRGMFNAWFTKHKLQDHIHGATTDYINARRIINGTDKAGMIAGYAKQFQKILENSAAVSMPDLPTTLPDRTQDALASDLELSQTAASDFPPPIIPVEQTTPAVTNTSVEAVVIEKTGGTETTTTTTAQTLADPIEVTKESPSWMVKIAAPFTALAGIGINAGSFIQTKLEQMTVQQIVYMIAALGLVALSIWWWHRSAKAAQARTMQLVEKASNRDATTVILK